MDPEMAHAGEEEHHEKTSVFRKVKDKARKIRDSFGMKSHGHNEHDDEVDEPDEGEQVVQDPDTHAAPTYDSTAPRSFSEDQDVNLEHSKGTLAESYVINPRPSGIITTPIEDTEAPKDLDVAEREEVDLGQSKFTMDETLGEDLNAPMRKHHGVSPPNYPCKVTAPGTGHGEEAGVLHSFDKMNINDVPQHKKETTSSIADTKNSGEDIAASKTGYGGTNDNMQTQEDMNVNEPAAIQNQPSYISSVTSAIGGTAVSAKNAVASRLGYGSNNDNVQTQEGMNVDEPTTIQSQPSYTSSVTSAISGAAISAKNAVGSKLGYGSNNDNVQTQNDRENVISAREPLASTENLSANESTLGYGGSDGPGYGGTGYGADNTVAAMGTEVNTRENNEKSSTVTDKLEPVYGTAAGAGSEVLAKIPGIGMGKDTGKDNTMDSPRETGTGDVGETDKGVVGMKGYILEKLKPGEDDKALSEVISDALHTQKGGEETAAHEKRAVGEVVSDAFHKRNNEEDTYGENKPMGKVTESEEVANRLGSTEEEKTGMVPGSDSPRTGVVDKFKGAFTNWFGKGGETNPSQALNENQPHESQGTTGEVENVSDEGERKLAESTK